jgi:hypothetical protein
MAVEWVITHLILHILRGIVRSPADVVQSNQSILTHTRLDGFFVVNS